MTNKKAFRLEDWLVPAVVLVAGLVVIAPLLQPGYFWGAHDARHDVYFIFQYDRAVQDGIWFPRWGPDWTFGYGYPFWITYGPAATFVGELFHHFLGFGWEASVKAVLALSVLLSGMGMYGFVRSWLGRNAGLVAAVAYMAVPYHLVDVYVRAAMAESLALAWLPFVLWGFRATVHRPGVPSVSLAGIAYAALLWTSNLVAAIFTPGLAAYVLVLLLWRELDHRQAEPNGGAGARRLVVAIVKRSVSPLMALIVGFGLGAAFFVPMLFEMNNVNLTQWFGEYYDPYQHFVYLNQLFSPAWGFGISQAGPDDIAKGSLSYQLGAIPALLTAVAWATTRRLDRGLRRQVWFWGLWACLGILLTLGISAPAWRYLPLVRFAQFPWRYLMLAILPLSILPATLVLGHPERTAGKQPGQLRWQAAILAALLLLGSFPYLRAEVRQPTAEQGPVSYAALMRFQRTSDEMTGVTAWVDPAQRPMWSSMADEWVAGREVSTRVDYGQVPQDETLAVNAEGMGSAHEEVWYYTILDDRRITFNWFWYPGWKAYLLDGKGGRPVQQLSVQREDGPLARVVVPVPQGQGYVLLRFEDTPLRAVATTVTLATLGAVLIAFLWQGWFALRGAEKSRLLPVRRRNWRIGEQGQ